MGKTPARSETTSILSVVANQGPVATTTTTTTTTTTSSSKQTSTPTSTRTNNNSSDGHTQSQGPTSADHSQQALDFIGSGPAVKSLFSIPISEQPVCVAVHNVNGTLLIDEVVVPDDSGTSHWSSSQSSSTSSSSSSSGAPSPQVRSNSASKTAAGALSQGASLALALSQEDFTKHEALSAVLSSMLQTNSNANATTTTTTSETRASNSSSPSSSSSSSMVIPASMPSPVQEYVRWNLQDMNLLIGSDAVVVRSEDSKSSGVLVRVEDLPQLRHLATSFQPLTGNQNSSTTTTASSSLSLQQSQSYAQALLKPSPDPPATETSESPGKSKNDPLNLDQVQLQTCIIPSSGPLNTRMPPPPVHRGSVDGTTFTTGDSRTPLSPKCFVLDAYLDNLMTNIPQLALCLKEKGLVQSVKLIDRDQIPSMMMHPNTLDTSKPFSILSKSQTPADESNLFSPEVMETNASALLRFLKANCTQNNSTYLLRADTSGVNNIQLFDISSISQQRQKKWIWWLATMSYRFALRLRQLEAHDALPMRQRAFRDRQRSLLQSTLDLLQDLHDMDGKAHESMVASVREHLADTYLGEFSGTAERSHTANTTRDRSNSDVTLPPSPILSSSPTSPSTTSRSRNGSPPRAIAAAEASKDRSTAPLRPGQSQTNPSPSHSASSSGPQHPQPESFQPYVNISTDALNKANDHLMTAIKALKPVLEAEIRQYTQEPEGDSLRTQSRRRRKRGQSSLDMESKEDELGDDEKAHPPSPAMVSQLFGLHFKLVNVSLRLAEHYLRQYSSSSAMQALRTAARRMADSVSLLEYMSQDGHDWTSRLHLQSVWLWDHAGHFARSFASDELWRDRGHASGDDIVSVLQDIEAAFAKDDLHLDFSNRRHPLEIKSKGQISLHSLSAICNVLSTPTAITTDTPTNSKTSSMETSKLLKEARALLANQGQLKRDKRQVLVASCISYGTAIDFFEELARSDENESIHAESSSPIPDHTQVLNLLQQRLGDACNETGKVLLASIRGLLTKGEIHDPRVADLLLDSAHFWFQEGLVAFEACKDVCNVSLLRCNLCQCFKLRANNTFTSRATTDASHAEVCLEEAASHLQAAHESLGEKEVDPMTWDMVSEELAATFLVLAVRRRQFLLGGGNVPVLLEALRLSPGKERSIAEPMEQALRIYQESGNLHQAAAVHYQLALTNSKIWTCQRDEAKTREKLSAAFQHYNQAFAYFSHHVRGDEPTFVLLCLDIASLYTAVSGEECLVKALTRCLDTYDAFSPAALEYVSTGRPLKSQQQQKEWMVKMETLGTSVDERIFKLLRSLVKLNGDRWKDLYREGLTAKMVQSVRPDAEEDGTTATSLAALHDVLVALRTKFSEINLIV